MPFNSSLSDQVDVIVVGSGPSGTIAAARLLERGAHVLMLDVGDSDERYRALIPNRPFERIRREESLQHAYLLGLDFEGVDLDGIGPLAQATPPRQHVFKRAVELLRQTGDDFAAVQSLATGGLGQAWGAGAFPFTPYELGQAGLDPVSIAPHYEAVAKRIGISGDTNDDLTLWRGALNALQPAHRLDRNASAVLARYQRYRQMLHKRRLRIGRPLLAMLSRSLDERKANPEHGLDYWSDAGDSVFRPATLLNSLRRCSNFSYRRGVLVTRFTDRANAAVEVEAVDLESCSTVQLLAGRVILAAGALGTTRIALRSLEAYDQAVPLVCNEHAYIPSLRLAGVGDGTAPPAHALAQLTAMLDPTGDQQHLVQAQLYSFTGMLLTRLLKESPLAYRESLPLFSTLAPAIVTSVVQHEDRPHPDKYCVLRRGATPLDDALEIRWQPERDCMREARNTRKTLAGLLRRLGCWPLGIIEPGPGSSIHYGGMFAPSDQELPLTVARDGVLRGTRRVHVVDGAGFAYLPAKGPTLTLMANAHRIADAIVFR